MMQKMTTVQSQIKQKNRGGGSNQQKLRKGMAYSSIVDENALPGPVTAGNLPNAAGGGQQNGLNKNSLKVSMLLLKQNISMMENTLNNLSKNNELAAGGGQQNGMNKSAIQPNANAVPVQTTPY